MRDIDLIPPEYLRERRLKRQLIGAGLAVAALLAGAGIARLTLELAIARLRPAIERAEQQAARAAQERATLLALSERNLALQSRLRRLDAQRRAMDWQTALRGLDGAFGPGLWFDELDLVRQTEPAAPPSTAPAAQTPPPSASAPPAEPAATAPTLGVRGHAVDHAGVTRLMERLRSQPGLADIRLLDTGLRRYATTEVVDFSISARIVTPAEPAP